MKQNITNEQFLNLTFEQSLKLMDIMGYPHENTSEEFYYNNKHIIARRFVHVIEKINIGKMIEILLDNIAPTNCVEDSLDIECDRVTKTSFVEYRNNNFEFSEFKGKELCDALWESVKSIL